MSRKLFSDPDPAQRHAPSCRAEFMVAAKRLRDDQGLKPDDIAQILSLSVNAVRELLYQADTGTEKFGTSVPFNSRREKSP